MAVQDAACNMTKLCLQVNKHFTENNSAVVAKRKTKMAGILFKKWEAKGWIPALEGPLLSEEDRILLGQRVHDEFKEKTRVASKKKIF